MRLSYIHNQIMLNYRLNKSKGKKKYLFFVELMIVSGMFMLSVLFWKILVEPDMIIGRDFYKLGILNLGSWIIFYRLTVIAKMPRTRKYTHVFFQFVRISFISLILLMLFKILLGLHSVSYIFIMLYSGFNLFAVFHFRIFSYSIFKIYRINGYDLQKVIVIADWYSDKFIDKILNEKEWGFQISKIISDSRLIKNKFGNTYQVLSKNTDIKKIIDNEVIDEVIYCKGDIQHEEITNLVEICNEIGVIFRMQSELSPLEDLQIQLKTLNNSSQMSLVDAPSSSMALLFKQISDIYFSLTMIVLLFPLFLLIGILIKLESRGPVFFKQVRVGLRGRRFNLYKFRTMIPEAEQLKEKLFNNNEADGPVFKIKSDPRITKVGKILRKTGLDELPQLYNVIRGEMSLIGPRPSLPAEVEKYERWQLRRLSVKPGITCTWQILPNRHGVKFENWMKLDLQYIDNWSLYMDMSLFFRTIYTFFTAKGH